MVKIHFFLFVLLLPTITSGQEPRPLQPLPRPKPRIVAQPPETSGDQPATAKPSGLEENITLKLQGDFQGLVPLDLELTGNGHKFSTDYISHPEKEGDPPAIITFTASVTRTPDSSYQVSYTVGARLAVALSSFRSPNGPVARNIEYRDISLSGTAKLTEGHPLVISRVNGAALTLSISQATAEDAE